MRAISYRLIIIARNAFLNLKANDPLRLAAATAFFTFFALPTWLIIVSQVLEQLLEDPAAFQQGRLLGQLSSLLGRRSASQLDSISEHLQQVPLPTWLSLPGVAFLLLVATTLLMVIQGSLNQLWNIKPTPHHSLAQSLKGRLVGVGILLGSSVLMAAYLAIDAGLQPTPSRPAFPSGLLVVARNLVAGGCLSLWVGGVFRYLPDARLAWKALLIGALLTSTLLMLGGWLLQHLLANGGVSRMYGASAAMVMVLLFTFYSSLIFYYGAAFSRSYAQHSGLSIRPTRQAVAYRITEVVKNPPLPDG